MADVEVSLLQLGQKERLRKQFEKMWEQVGDRILKLPPFVQKIVLADIHTAIENRVAIMEMIQNAKRTNRVR